MRRICSALVGSVVMAGLAVLATTPSASAVAWLPEVDVTDAPAAAVDTLATATAPDGTFVVAWTESVDGSAASWSVRVAARAPGAAEFSRPVEAGAPGARVTHVVVVVDGTGATTVGWVRTVAGSTGVKGWVEVARRQRSASDFDAPETLAEPELGLQQVLAVGDGQGRVTMLWTSLLDEVHSATWEPALAGWSVAKLADGGSARELALAVDGAGSVTAAWLWTPGFGLSQVQTRTRPAASAVFGPMQTHSRADGVVPSLGLASNPSGDTVLAWWQELADASGYVLRVADRQPGATSFGRAIDAATNSRRVQRAMPRMLLDDAGNLTIAWDDSSPNLLVITRPVGGAFEAPTRVPMGALGPDVFSLDGGPDGSAVLTWTEFVTNGRIPTKIARAAYRSPGGEFGAPTDVSPPVAGGSDGLIDASVDDEGDVQVAWTRLVPDADDDRARVHARVLDASAPGLHDVAVPATGTAGAPVTMSASASDVWSGPPSLSWAYGDGSTGTGGSTSHVYAAAGSYVVRVTATDGAGNTRSMTRRIAVGDTTAPVLTGVRLTPRRLPTGKGARLRATTSEQAILVGVVQRKRDDRWRAVGTKRWSLATGENDKTFYGKTSEQRLRSGRYRVRLTATDAAGNTSATATIGFRVDRG